jgi:hypothetical protein
VLNHSDNEICTIRKYSKSHFKTSRYLKPLTQICSWSPLFLYEGSHKMLEWSEGLADWAQHHIQEIQVISPHVSTGPSDKSTQFGHLSHLDPFYHSRSQETTTLSSVDWVGKFVFLCWYCTKYSFSPVMITIMIVL